MNAKEMFEELGYQQSGFSPQPSFLPVVTYLKIKYTEPDIYEEQVDVGQTIECNVDFIEFKQILERSIGVYNYKGYLKLEDDGNFYFFDDKEHIWEVNGLLTPNISMSELKAINKQCEELGWIKCKVGEENER